MGCSWPRSVLTGGSPTGEAARCASVSGCSRCRGSSPARAAWRSSCRRVRRSRTPGRRSWLAFPNLAPGRALRFARNGAYSPPETPVGDGDEVAMIRRSAAARRTRRGACHPRAARGAVRRSILAELSARLATRRMGGRRLPRCHRRSPGSPRRPGGRCRAAHAGRVVESLRLRAHPEMALRVIARSRTRSRRALADTARDRASRGRGAARRAIGRNRRLRAPPGRGVQRRALRDRRDEGARAHLEGRAI